MEKIRNNWALILSLFIFWLIMVILFILCLIANAGHFIYALDDTYIHMALAKNFSQHGVWGVTKFEFSSSSSSLLYSLLLSLLFLIFGPNELIPLIINLIFANLLICFVYYILKIKYNLPSYATLVGILSIIFFLPLHSLVFIGMEHTLQVLINLIFIFKASKIISEDKLLKRSNLSLEDKKLFFLTPLVSMIRFEGMFLIIMISFLFLLRKKYFYGLMIAGLGFSPVIIYGCISVTNGWYFLPNPVVLKGSISDFKYKSLANGLINFFDPMDIISNPHLLVLFAGALLILYLHSFKEKKIQNEIPVLCLIFIGTLLFQKSFAVIKLSGIFLSRYDAYLVAIGIILIFISIKNNIPQSLSLYALRIFFFEKSKNFEYAFFKIITVFLIIILFFTPLYYRAYNTLGNVPQATNNIYEQQYQMGLFLQKYYQGKCIAANDIGAINYLSDIECLDIRGLASQDMAEARINDDLDEDFVYKAAKRRDCKIAIIYEDKDYIEIPSEWVKVGEWEIENNVVCADDTVSFWAVDPDEVDDLIDHLQDFSRYLPNTVEEYGNYTK